MVQYSISIFGYASATGLLLLLSGFIWLIIRWFRRSPIVSTPSCGKCHYVVVGLPGRTCPECGSDLDEVGVLMPGDRKRLGRVGWIIVWTCLLPAPALLVTGFVMERVPVIAIAVVKTQLATPASGAYQSIRLQTPASGMMPSSPAQQDLMVSLVMLDGSQHSLLVTPDGGDVTYTLRDGLEVLHEGPLSADVLTKWMEGLGLDTDEPRIVTEIQSVLAERDNLAGAFGRSLAGSGSSAGATSGGGGVFSATSSSSTWSSRKPPNMLWYTATANLTVWLAGAGLIWWLKRPRYI